MRHTALATAICALIAAVPAAAQIDTSILRPVGYHPSNVAYFNTPYFANAAAHGGEWFEFTGFDFGTAVDFNAAPAQFINGYPQFLNSGKKLRGFLYGLNIDDPFRPAGWPSRLAITKGHVVLTWAGNADVRLPGCTFISGAESNGAPETGLVNNGRRSYICSNGLTTFEIHALQTPLTELKVWLPALDNPATVGVDEKQTTSLENQTFHPLLLQRIADKDWGFIRFMDWGNTNGSPVKNWSERRKPGHIFQNGVISKRSPLDDGEIAFVDGPRETGVAYEHMIALCNATNKNMWINIPHLATSDYITKLAQVIRFGSDANGDPALTGSPVFPPLNSGLKIYIEFSNEIWSGGFAFPQGDWAQSQTTLNGLPDTFEGRARFNARRFCDTWRIFQTVFGGNTRLVRVAATFTANNTYTDAFLAEMATYGTDPSKGAATRPDVLAITTYFGNGIQDFVNEQGFTTGKLFNDPYWTSPTFAANMTTAFDEWKRRILAGDAAAGAGPDATGIGGGFDGVALRAMMDARLSYRLPIVAYEGGPSLFTNNIDSGNAVNGDGVPTDDGVTTFIEAMNRDPRIADVYRIHLELARSKGLWTHNPYVDSSQWGRFGQWGHLETLDSNPATQPKWALMKEHFDTFTSVRHSDVPPTGTVPQWVSPSPDALVAIVGNAYTITINTSAGDGARTVTIISTLLDPGLTATKPTASTLSISGTPTVSGKNFVFARVVDSDGDASWNIFIVHVFGGPGTLIQSDLQNETNPALNLPWTKTHVLSPKVTWTGWNVGAGTTGVAGNDAIRFQVSGNANSDGETLTQAITDNEFLTFTVTPATGPIDLRLAEFRFSVSRADEHAPTGYAVFSSITGFAEANLLGSLVYNNRFDTSEQEKVLLLPNTASFSAVNAALTFRIVTFGGKFDGHPASLTAFKLTENLPPCCTTSIPTNVVATSDATATSVAVTWTAVDGASSYQIVRRANGGTETTFTSATNGFTDTTPASNQAFLYRVRAVGPSGTSGDSTRSLATTVAFTNDPLLVASTLIKGEHLIQLRSAVEAVRALAALTATTYTDAVITAGSTTVRTIHVSELRTALSSALTTLGFGAPSFSTGLSTGSPVKQSHFQELRELVR